MQVRREKKDYGYYEVYLCQARGDGSAPDCPQSAVSRAAVDEAVAAYFERVGVDVDETKRQLAEAGQREHAEIGALRSQAEREQAKVEAGLAKIESDYTLGDLPATDYTRLRAGLEEQAAASRHALARLTQRESEVVTDKMVEDVNLLTRLAELRSAVATEVTESADFDAMRDALRRVFESFQLRAVPGLFRRSGGCLGRGDHGGRAGRRWLPADPRSAGWRGDDCPRQAHGAAGAARPGRRGWRHLVITMNLCPCGGRGDPAAQCSCSAQRLARYRDKLSRALLDRFDLVLAMPRVRGEELAAAASEGSVAVAQRVATAREQLATKPPARDAEADALLRRAADRLHLSGRGYARVGRVARTIAALAGSDAVRSEHVAEALSYRSPDEFANV